MYYNKHMIYDDFESFNPLRFCSLDNAFLPNLSNSSFLNENQDIISLSYDENKKKKFFLNEKPFNKEDEKSTDITDLCMGKPKQKSLHKFLSLDDEIITKLKSHNINLFSEKDSKLLEEVQKQLEKETQKDKGAEGIQKGKIFLNKKTKIKYEEIYEEEKERGRRKSNDKSERAHNKMSPDNIIKKLKKDIINSIISFVNQIIEKRTNRGKDIIKKLDYTKYNNKLKVDQNIKDLQKPFKEILSYNITPKFKNLKYDSNKTTIELILNEYQNDNIIQFVFNLTISEWIDIFLLNKNLKDYSINLDETEYKDIEIPDINELFSKYQDDKEYLAKYIFYLYNYKNYFYNKKGRAVKRIEKRNEVIY